MSGITITNVKIVGICSKCRKAGDEILRDKNGREYKDSEISCVSCALKTKKRICIKCGKDCEESGWCPDCECCEDCMDKCTEEKK